jgi:hypothetical protein
MKEVEMMLRRATLACALVLIAGGADARARGPAGTRQIVSVVDVC